VLTLSIPFIFNTMKKMQQTTKWKKSLFILLALLQDGVLNDWSLFAYKVLQF